MKEGNISNPAQKNQHQLGYYLIGLFALLAIIFVSMLISTRPEIGGAGVVYKSVTNDFSIEYPKDFQINESYSYELLATEEEIKGVSFTVPESLSNGTNLSSDSYISVEQLSFVPVTCSASLFLANTLQKSTLREDGTTYDVALGGGAGAGNFYQETVFALPESVPCTAVRYFIHSTNIGNYEEGTVVEFNSQGLYKTFDHMRRTLDLSKQES